MEPRDQSSRGRRDHEDCSGVGEPGQDGVPEPGNGNDVVRHQEGKRDGDLEEGAQ